MIKKIWGRTKRFLLTNNSAAVFKVAGLCIILILMMMPLALNVVTNARFTTEASFDAQARVASWNVVLNIENMPANTVTIPAIPVNGTEAGHPLVLFFQGRTADTHGIGAVAKSDASFPAKFINNSEVAARFVPKIEVDAPTDAEALNVVKSKIRFMLGTDDVTDTGTIIPAGEFRDVNVVIKNSTFTNLKIGAVCEQVD